MLVFDKNINFQNFRDLKRSKIGLQVRFRNIVYTVLNHFEPCVSLVTSELSENLKIRPKSTNTNFPLLSEKHILCDDARLPVVSL